MSISNASTHNLNATLDMRKFYNYLGLKKKTTRRASPSNPGAGRSLPNRDAKSSNRSIKSKKNKGYNTMIDIVTMVKRVQFNYSENNGTYLPGYLETPGFIGTLKPSIGYTFGSQRDIRQLAARNGWLTVFPDFNQQYTENHTNNLDYSINVEPVRDLKIDLTGGRTFAETLTESFNTTDTDFDGLSDTYNRLISNTFGSYNISTSIIKTAFNTSDENGSATFDDFRENRLVVARRLAQDAGVDFTNPNNFENGDLNDFPLGYGKTNQAVLLPAFLAAYGGKDAGKVDLGAFRDFPIPNWTLRYTGFMKIKWFKKHFKRFSLTHGYNSTYTINQFRTNLDFNEADQSLDYVTQQAQQPEVFDQSGNYKNETLFSNINLSEQFSPLIKIDFEMKNSLRILAEIRKDRLLSLSFDNNLLTEIQGNEYIIGVGYRIKDVKIRSKIAGPRQIVKSDLNMKADISIRDNKTIIRFLDVENNQVTSGQTIWSFSYSADYAFSKALTAIFYFDYAFSKFAISTAFPQTTIRSGLTLRYSFGN